MSYADYLRKRREAFSAVITKFEQRHQRVPETLFCFFEGAIDPIVYVDAIKGVFSAQPLLNINCEGKKGVVGAFTEITKRYGQLPNVLFFLDRDYDDLTDTQAPHHPSIFITHGYSFESEYTTLAAVDCVFSQVLNVQWTAEEQCECLSIFEVGYASFVKRLEGILGVAVHIRKAKGAVNFGNVHLEQLIHMDRDGAVRRKRGALSAFLRQASTNGGVSVWSARNTIRQLKKLPPLRAMRGKFSTWYALRFIGSLCDSLRQSQVAGEPRKFIPTQLHEDSLAQLMAPRIALVGLAEFLSGARQRYEEAMQVAN